MSSKIKIKRPRGQKVGDPNAKAMWGRCRTQVYKDKTKYTRKTKYKNFQKDK